MPDSHTIIITPYWFLGLLEGKGSFSLQGQPMFRLVLREEQRPVLESLKIFIDQLGQKLEYSDLKIDVIFITEKQKINLNHSMRFKFRIYTIFVIILFLC
jgi:hypothetical protein